MGIPAWLLEAIKVTVWTSTASVLWFVLQYTLTSPWWRDPVGRTVIAKDGALLVLLVPSCLLLVWPQLFTMAERAAIELASLALITVFMAWRSVVWWRIKPPRLRRKKPISRGELGP